MPDAYLDAIATFIKDPITLIFASFLLAWVLAVLVRMTIKEFKRTDFNDKDPW